MLVFVFDVGCGRGADDGGEVGRRVVEGADDVAYAGFGRGVEFVVVLAGEN